MKKIYKDILKYVLSAALAAILAYFSFREVKWADFIVVIGECRWWWIVVSMVLGIAVFFLRAERWRRLILPLDGSVSHITTFNAVNIGYIANFVFPRIGEFVRCGVVSRNSPKATYDKVLGTVVLERTWDLISMLVFLTVLLFSRWDKFGGFFVREIWQPSSARLDFSLWWIVAAFAVVCLSAVWIVWKYRGCTRICSKVYGVFAGIWQGIISFVKMDGKWMFLLDTVLIWAMYWGMAASTMRAVPELDTLTMVDALFLSLAGSLGWVVPVPGGIGAFHFIVSLALSTIYGLSFSQGLVFATLSHESQALTMILFGGLSFLWESLRGRSSSVTR